MSNDDNLPSPLLKEAQGDWSVFKGTHYHLLYTAWLLVHKNIPEVAFYAGNDLLVRKIVPPKELTSTDTVGIQLPSIETTEDEWIQLKNDNNKWTLNRIVKAEGEENKLLPTFIYNALHSEAQNRKWRVSLVSPQGVNKKTFQDFLKNVELHELSPSTNPAPEYYSEFLTRKSKKRMLNGQSIVNSRHYHFLLKIKSRS